MHKLVKTYIILMSSFFISSHASEVRTKSELDRAAKYYSDGNSYICSFVNIYAISEGNGAWYGPLKNGIDKLISSAELYSKIDKKEAKRIIKDIDLYKNDLDPDDLEETNKKIFELKNTL